jgi:glycoside hydrolase family 93
MMRIFAILTTAIIAVLSCSANERIVSYARLNQNVTFNLEWGANNYGQIQWQKSDDNGTTWTDIPDAIFPVFTVKATGPALYRAVVNGDPACAPIIAERELKTVSIYTALQKAGADYIDLKIITKDFEDADIIEYGYTASFSGLKRDYTLLPKNKVGDRIPDYSGTFTMKCSGLTPSSDYYIRPYFVTKDGSTVYGASKSVTTVSGLKFDSENWIIEKDRVQIPFSITDYLGADPAPEIWFGIDRGSMKKYEVESLGSNKFRSSPITELTPGTTYIAVVKALVNGEIMEIEKEVTTWSDYSAIAVDSSVKPVSHTVEWDNENLICLTPEVLQVEYPRMCRVDENKILLTYHGGTENHWQNSYLRKSYDNGKTWTRPVTIYNATDVFHGSEYYRICNPEMTRLRNGWIILTAIANGKPESNYNCKVIACISKDKGETWSDPIIVGRGRTWEPQVVQLPNGELELLVSSEAFWWENQRDNLFQEILSSRSTDNGETWTAFKRASYKPGARDGMPVSVVMQGNKGVMFVEESVNGGISPSLQFRSLDGEWDTEDWDGKQDENRWLTGLAKWAGAPYMIQLPTGEFLIMAHTAQTGSVWQTSRPQVIMADNTGHNFKFSTKPLNGAILPSECGAYYNSFFLYDDNTVWLLFTKAQYKGQKRMESNIMMMEGKIVERQSIILQNELSE